MAYISEIQKEVQEMLLKLSPRSTTHLNLKRCSWQRGTEIKVRLSGSHVIVSQPEESFTWDGEMNMIDFDVMVPEDAPEAITVLNFEALISKIVVAKLRIDLE